MYGKLVKYNPNTKRWDKQFDEAVTSSAAAQAAVLSHHAPIAEDVYVCMPRGFLHAPIVEGVYVCMPRGFQE